MFESTLAGAIHEMLPQLALRENEPLSAHCSFRIGGPAEIFAEPASERELERLLPFLRDAGVPVHVIGNGTNMLFSDSGVRGVVIKIGEKLSEVRAAGERLSALSGVTLARLAAAARDNSLAGLEFAHGIPGSLGGGIVMNAGAYGGELKDVVRQVRAIGPDGGIRVFSGEENCFSYRCSRFSNGAYVVIGAELELVPGEQACISARMRELMAKRAASQPLDKASAGSTFKRPQSGYAAALIDEAGLKGYRVGGAQVSEKHAGFVVNLGGASFDEVLAVMEHVQDTVYARFGVALEPEVRIIRG